MKIKNIIILVILICNLGTILTMQRPPAIQLLPLLNLHQNNPKYVDRARSLEQLAARAIVREHVRTGPIPHVIHDIITRERNLLNFLATHNNNPTDALLAYLPTIQAQPHLADHELIQDLLACEKWGASALHELVFNGNNKSIIILLDHGANVDTRNIEGFGPLYHAIKSGNQATITLLLQRGANINAQTINGRTYLHDAIMMRNQAAVALLLQNGADINAQDNLGNSPLRLAIAFEFKEIVELLLQYGAI